MLTRSHRKSHESQSPGKCNLFDSPWAGREEGDKHMGAVAKNLAPQLVPSPAQPTFRSFMFDDPVTASQTIGLKEARQLSKFVPVLVLVPAPSRENRSVGAAARNMSPVENPETA